jgi:hypothetical protein
VTRFPNAATAPQSGIGGEEGQEGLGRRNDEMGMRLGAHTGMRSVYFCLMRSASALRLSNGCSSLNLDRILTHRQQRTGKTVLPDCSDSEGNALMFCCCDGRGPVVMGSVDDSDKRDGGARDGRSCAQRRVTPIVALLPLVGSVALRNLSQPSRATPISTTTKVYIFKAGDKFKEIKIHTHALCPSNRHARDTH